MNFYVVTWCTFVLHATIVTGGNQHTSSESFREMFGCSLNSDYDTKSPDPTKLHLGSDINVLKFEAMVYVRKFYYNIADLYQEFLGSIVYNDVDILTDLYRTCRNEHFEDCYNKFVPNFAHASESSRLAMQREIRSNPWKFWFRGDTSQLYKTFAYLSAAYLETKMEKSTRDVYPNHVAAFIKFEVSEQIGYFLFDPGFALDNPIYVFENDPHRTNQAVKSIFVNEDDVTMEESLDSFAQRPLSVMSLEKDVSPFRKNKAWTTYWQALDQEVDFRVVESSIVADLHIDYKSQKKVENPHRPTNYKRQKVVGHLHKPMTDSNGQTKVQDSPKNSGMSEDEIKTVDSRSPVISHNKFIPADTKIPLLLDDITDKDDEVKKSGVSIIRNHIVYNVEKPYCSFLRHTVKPSVLSPNRMIVRRNRDINVQASLTAIIRPSFTDEKPPIKLAYFNGRDVHLFQVPIDDVTSTLITWENMLFIGFMREKLEISEKDLRQKIKDLAAISSDQNFLQGMARMRASLGIIDSDKVELWEYPNSRNPIIFTGDLVKKWKNQNNSLFELMRLKKNSMLKSIIERGTRFRRKAISSMGSV